jgi:hypothetical protein
MSHGGGVGQHPGNRRNRRPRHRRDLVHVPGAAPSAWWTSAGNAATAYEQRLEVFRREGHDQGGEPTADPQRGELHRQERRQGADRVLVSIAIR